MIRHFFIVAGFLLTMCAGISMTAFVSNLFDCSSDSNGFGKAFLSFTKKLTCVALTVDALAIAVPNKDEMIAMYVAGRITPANIQATGEFTGQTVDTLMDKILKASKAMEGK